MADGEENKNQGVVKASTKCKSFVLETIDRVFKYGDTKKIKHKLIDICLYVGTWNGPIGNSNRSS